MDADNLFSKLPRSRLSLESMTYYYALQIHQHLLRRDAPAHVNVDPVYLHAPADISRQVLSALNRKKDYDVMSDLVARLRDLHRQLLDMSQVESLQRLGRGLLLHYVITFLNVSRKSNKSEL